jgi:hypothetical protein
MGAEFGIVHALWNHAADGGALLDRVAGEVGIEHVTVPVVTGALAEFRLGIETGQPYFHTEGGWHFPPTAKTYAATGIRPIKARWFGTADALAPLRRHVERLGIGLVLHIDLRSVPALVATEPHLGQRNAWGQDVPHAGACVSNPAVRELLRVTLEDLRACDAAIVQLADWLPDCATDSASPRPLDWHAPVRRLLDICFCAACRQIAERAGVAADGAARSVRVQAERALRTPLRAWQGHDDPVVQAYVESRAADSQHWLSRIAETEAPRRLQLVHAWGASLPDADEVPLERVVRLGRCRDGSDRPREALLGLPEAVGAAGWVLPVWRSAFEEAAELVRVVGEAARAGVRHFDFEGLDEAPAEAVTWLKQAVRFARRG